MKVEAWLAGLAVAAVAAVGIYYYMPKSCASGGGPPPTPVFTMTGPADAGLNTNYVASFTNATPNGQVGMSLAVPARSISVGEYDANADSSGSGTDTADLGSNAFESGDVVYVTATDFTSGQISKFKFNIV